MSDFNVMLAHPYGKKEFDKDSFIQPKLDGVRCYITKDGAFSRNHKEFKTVDHIKDAFKPLFKKLPDLVVDGELYNHQFKDNFNKIISLVRKQKPNAEELDEATRYIQFHWYDYVLTRFDEDTAVFRHRDQMIKKTIEELGSRHIIEVPTYEVSILEVARLWHKDFLEKGYEGSIIRLNKQYEQKRSYNLQKFKDFHDTEATITGYVEGKGKRSGTIGKFLAVDSSGIHFGMPVMEDYDTMAMMLVNVKDYIGKTATFTYFQKTPRGSYRHPLFKSIRNYE
jgi:DNA ligase-1